MFCDQWIDAWNAATSLQGRRQTAPSADGRRRALHAFQGWGTDLTSVDAGNVFMHRHRNAFVQLFTAVLCVGHCLGCAPSPEVCVKNAYLMYEERRQDLGRPSDRWYLFVDREIGRDQFVSTLCPYTRTKYRIESAYCIGWFGSASDASTLGRLLDDPNPETLRVAMAGFERLTGQSFASVEDARRYYSEHGKKSE